MALIKKFLKLFFIIGITQLLINVVSNDFWIANVEKVFIFSVVISMVEMKYQRGKYDDKRIF